MPHWLKKGLHRIMPTASCPLCGMKILAMSISKHLRKRHQNYQVVCPLCSITFEHPIHYRAHMQTVHWNIYDPDKGYCHNVQRIVDHFRLQKETRRK